MKHTRGPWMTNPEGIGECVVGSSNRMVCECYEDGETQNDEDHANAHLIAAAPDLLEALQEYYEAAEANTQCCRDVLSGALAKADDEIRDRWIHAGKKARAAIARAKGE